MVALGDGVEDDIAAHIASRLSTTPGPGQLLSPVDLVVGENLRTGPPRKATNVNSTATGKVPEVCVFVHATGGLQDIAYHDLGEGKLPTGEPDLWCRIQQPFVDIWTRGPAADYPAGLALAEAVHASIDKSLPTGYLESRAQTARPNHVGEDAQNHHQWTTTVELMRELGT